jgi:hypothetical protein
MHGGRAVAYGAPEAVLTRENVLDVFGVNGSVRQGAEGRLMFLFAGGLIPRPLGRFNSYATNGGVADPQYRMRKVRRTFSSRPKPTFGWQMPRCLRRGSSFGAAYNSTVTFRSGPGRCPGDFLGPARGAIIAARQGLCSKTYSIRPAPGICLIYSVYVARL